MTVLLDTHAFLWWIADNPLLSAHAQSVTALLPPLCALLLWWDVVHVEHRADMF